MISQTADYALRAVVAMALRGDQMLTLRELSDATGVSAPYLAKVLRALTRAGLVHSQRGTGGGYGMAASLEAVSLLDVVYAVDPPRRGRGGCLADRVTQPCRLCGLHRRIDAGLSMAETLFARSTLAELVRDPGCPPLCSPDDSGRRSESKSL